MKTFKTIDIAIQLIIIVAAFLLWNRYTFFIIYYGVGSWQVLSCVVHFLVYKKRERNLSRRVYEKTLLVIAGIVASGLILFFLELEAGIIILYYLAAIMLFGGAVMAVWYGLTCWMETRDMYRISRRKLPF